MRKNLFWASPKPKQLFPSNVINKLVKLRVLNKLNLVPGGYNYAPLYTSSAPQAWLHIPRMEWTATQVALRLN